MSRVRKLFCMLAWALSLAFFLQLSTAHAQTAATGQIVGTVVDPSKAAIALATITVTNEATALVRFSLGRESTLEEVDAVCDVLPAVISRVQQFQQG